MKVLDHPVLLAPIEEIFWSKAYRCSRWAYDGNDLFQLLEAVGNQMDWDHLLWRFGADWELLLSHLVLYRYVFPSCTDIIPGDVFDTLMERLSHSRKETWQAGPVCRGHIIDSSDTYDQYYDKRGYIDIRKHIWQRRQLEPSVVPTQD